MDHTTVSRQFFDRINEGDIAAIVAVLAEDFVGHEEMPGLTPGRDGVGELFAMFRAAFPDVRWEPEDVLADGDKLAARVRVTGTNDGEFMGMAPYGQARQRPAHRHRADWSRRSDRRAAGRVRHVRPDAPARRRRRARLADSSGTRAVVQF